MATESKKLNEVVWLRVYAIVSLVAWHCYCAYTSWGLATSPMDGYYSTFFRIMAPIANMPLFTFLSGYLFCYLHVYCGKYKSFKGFLQNKFRRLLIPYLVLGFVINMTQINRMRPVDLLWGLPNHLWYCLMLFYCFVVCWFVENKVGRWMNYILSIASFIFVFCNGGQYLFKSPLGVLIPVYFYCFFFFGYFVYSKRDSLLKNIKYTLPIIILLFLMSIKFSFRGHLQGVSAVLFIWALLIVANKIKKEPPLWLKTISNYSFGIFVFHQWIVWNVTRYSPISKIMNDHYILFPLLLFFSVFAISFVLTHLSLKTKLGRYLLA